MPDLAHVPPSVPEMPAPSPWAAGPVRFSFRNTPAGERAALYHEVFGRSVMRYEVAAAQDVPFDIDVTMQELPGLLMVTGRMHGSRNRRTQRWIADGLDDYAIAVNLGGKYVISQDDREIVLQDGEATLFSLGSTCGLMHWPPGRLLAMRLPRAQIAQRVSDADGHCLRRISASNPALTLLTDYVHLAQDRHAVASPDLQRHFVDHIYDLVAVTLGATPDAAHDAQGNGMRAARLNAIKRDIGMNLGDELTIAAVAARHGCTPRAVQRMFEAEGATFTEYLLTQRMRRAHRLLTDPGRHAEKVSAVAFDCGFSDVSYFNRVFRRHYGAAPSDFRAQAGAGQRRVPRLRR